MLDADIATLWDQFAYNAGFVVVRPTWYGRRVYELVRQRTNASSKLDDRTVGVGLDAPLRHSKSTWLSERCVGVATYTLLSVN